MCGKLGHAKFQPSSARGTFSN